MRRKKRKSMPANTIEFKKKKKKRTRMGFFSTRTLCWIAVPTLIGTSGYIQIEAQNKIKALETQKNEAISYKQQLERERDYLASRIELLNDSDFLSAIAKEKLMYTTEDEILFLFPE